MTRTVSALDHSRSLRHRDVEFKLSSDNTEKFGDIMTRIANISGLHGAEVDIDADEKTAIIRMPVEVGRRISLQLRELAEEVGCDLDTKIVVRERK